MNRRCVHRQQHLHYPYAYKNIKLKMKKKKIKTGTQLLFFPDIIQLLFFIRMCSKPLLLFFKDNTVD